MAVLECPECGARFSAPGAALGRKVRCGACGHVWRAEFGESEGEGAAAAPAVPDIPEGIKPQPEPEEAAAPEPEAPAEPEPEPEPKKPKRRKALKNKQKGPLLSPRAAGIIIAAALLGLLGFVLSALRDPIVEAWPAARAPYALLGAAAPAPDQSLVFDRLEVSAAGGFLELAGQIINLGLEARPLPAVEAVLIDSHDHVHGRFPVPLEHDVIEGGGSLAFAGRWQVDPMPPDASVTVRFVFFEKPAKPWAPEAPVEEEKKGGH